MGKKQYKEQKPTRTSSTNINFSIKLGEAEKEARRAILDNSIKCLT